MKSTAGLELRSKPQVRPVAVCGPVAKPGLPAAGGYEASNLRLMQLQASMGLHPSALCYPAVKGRPLAVKAWSYMAAFWNIGRRIEGLPPGTIVHFTPLCRQFIRYEERLIRRARSRGLPVVLDLRAGNKQSEYDARGPSYRSAFERLVHMADVVTVEGLAYIPFVRGIRRDVSILYLPNFIMPAEVATCAEPRPLDVIRLTYVGSVLEEKGLVQCVQLANELSARGVTAALEVIGPFRAEFARRLAQEAAGPGLLNLRGPQSFDAIKQTLAQSHFFLLLTEWPGEGHSNALTEAMGQGAIPIVTDHGFCRSVAGGDGIVVRDRNQTGAIADAVVKLIGEPGEMAARARRLANRVRTLYTSDAVRETLAEAYRSATAAQAKAAARTG